MDIRDCSMYLKTVKKAVELSVDKIVTKHPAITDHADFSPQEYDNIIQQIMTTNEIKGIIQRYVDDYEFYEMGKQNFVMNFEKSDMFDDTKFDSLISQYQVSKSISDKEMLLKTIFQFPLLDLIDKDKWTFVSKLMRDCLMSKSKHLFQLSFKMHIRFSNHPQCIMDATANLLKQLTMIFQSRKRQHLLSNGIETTQIHHSNVISLIGLVLQNIKHLNRTTNYAKDRNMENLIVQFMDLIMLIYIEKNEPLRFINYVAVIDPKAIWFRELMYTPINRNLLLQICTKHSIFIKYLVNEIVSTVNSIEYVSSRSIKTEISLELIQFATFSTSLTMLSILLFYKEGQQMFPLDIKITDRPITVHGLIIIILTSINNLSGFTKQTNKRSILISTTTEILVQNRHLLYNKEIADAFIKPLLLTTLEKHRLIDIAHRNEYILHIINEISNTQDGFMIIFGLKNEIQTKNYRRNKQYQYIRSVSLPEPFVISTFIDKFVKQHQCSYSATDRHQTSFGKIIIDFTTTLVRRYVNLFEKLMHIDDILFELYECCYSIYTCHSHVLYLVNSHKLISVTLNLFRILIDRNLIQNTMNPVVKFLVFICGTKSGMYLVKEDPEALYFICKTVFSLPETDLWRNCYFHKFFMNISDRVPGFRAIFESKKQLITPYLDKIWKLDEDELLYVSGSSRKMDETVFEFAKVVFTLSFSLHCIQALLANDSDDESTLVESDKKATNLSDLLEDTLSSSGAGTLACHVGLIAIRILINNINILIYLQHTLNLQETLQILQTECTTSFYDENTTQPNSEVVIDECSLLRRNILNYIQSICLAKQKSQMSQRNTKQLNQHSSSQSARNRKLNEMQRFLNESKNNLHDGGWLILARKIFKTICNEPVKETIFMDLIQQVRLTVPNTKNYFIWPDNSDNQLTDLFPEDHIGILTIIQFGLMNKILQPNLPNEDTLILLIKQVNSFLNIKRSQFNGFDWFVGVVFLLCSGNIERSKTVLQCMIHLPVTPYIWPMYSVQMGTKKKFSYLAHFDHTLNMLVEDLEVFKPALESACISWNAITRNWLDQCFFHIVEWNELANFLTMAILFPPEYVLFYLISAAQYLELKLLTAIHSNDINTFQKILQLEGFRIHDWMSSMDLMGRQYKNILSKY